MKHLFHYDYINRKKHFIDNTFLYFSLSKRLIIYLRPSLSFKEEIINPRSFASINSPNVLRYSFPKKRFTTFYILYAHVHSSLYGHEIFWMLKYVSSSALLTFVIFSQKPYIHTYIVVMSPNHTHIHHLTTKSKDKRIEK